MSAVVLIIGRIDAHSSRRRWLAAIGPLMVFADCAVSSSLNVLDASRYAGSVLESDAHATLETASNVIKAGDALHADDDSVLNATRSLNWLLLLKVQWLHVAARLAAFSETFHSAIADVGIGLALLALVVWGVKAIAPLLRLSWTGFGGSRIVAEQLTLAPRGQWWEFLQSLHHQHPRAAHEKARDHDAVQKCHRAIEPGCVPRVGAEQFEIIHALRNAAMREVALA
jgi:hypothetical protein